MFCNICIVSLIARPSLQDNFEHFLCCILGSLFSWRSHSGKKEMPCGAPASGSRNAVKVPFFLGHKGHGDQLKYELQKGYNS